MTLALLEKRFKLVKEIQLASCSPKHAMMVKTRYHILKMNKKISYDSRLEFRTSDRHRAKLTSNLGQPFLVDVRRDGMAEQQQNNLSHGPRIHLLYKRISSTFLDAKAINKSLNDFGLNLGQAFPFFVVDNRARLANPAKQYIRQEIADGKVFCICYAPRTHNGRLK